MSKRRQAPSPAEDMFGRPTGVRHEEETPGEERREAERRDPGLARSAAEDAGTDRDAAPDAAVDDVPEEPRRDLHEPE